MSAIKALLDEVRFEMLKVILLNAFLDGTILFLGLLLLLSVFGIGPLLPLLFALLFFAFQVWRYWQNIDLEYIEERNPSLREALRTAADNQEAESLMAHALFAEVIERMRKVSSGTFLNFKRLITKIATMFALSLIILSLAFFNVNIQKFENPLAGVGENLRDRWSELQGEPRTPSLNLSGEDDIYGEARIAQLGAEELDITLEQSLNQIDFQSVEEADPASADSLDDFPVDVAAEAGEAYTDGLEEITDRKTAAEYSQEIKR